MKLYKMFSVISLIAMLLCLQMVMDPGEKAERKSYASGTAQGTGVGDLYGSDVILTEQNAAGGIMNSTESTLPGDCAASTDSGSITSGLSGHTFDHSSISAFLRSLYPAEVQHEMFERACRFFDDYEAGRITDIKLNEAEATVKCIYAAETYEEAVQLAASLYTEYGFENMDYELVMAQDGRYYIGLRDCMEPEAFKEAYFRNAEIAAVHSRGFSEDCGSRTETGTKTKTAAETETEAEAETKTAAETEAGTKTAAKTETGAETETAEKIYAYIHANIRMGENRRDTRGYTGFFEGYDVLCGGISAAFSQLCMLNGIECTGVLGWYNGAEHEWNRLIIDGNVRYADLTYDTGIVSEPGENYISRTD